MTGEVVTGTEERLATGDAVNVAARLEQAAQPGDVLIGEPTLELVRDRVDVAPIDPLELKGKAEPVPAYRLLRVHDAPERRHEAPFVGRQRELAILREAWERVQAEPRCELVTVAGDAGVGKSRLAAEFLASIEATVLRGRCLPYGEGITYWPVVEVLKQLDLVPSGRGRRGRDPVAAGRDGRADVRGGDRLGLPQDAGGSRRRTAGRGRLRRHPVGRGNVPRPDRTHRAAVLGRVDPALLHRAARAHRAPAHVAGDASARTDGRRRRRRAHRRPDRRRAAREDRSRSGRQPAVPRGDAGDGRRGAW